MVKIAFYLCASIMVAAATFLPLRPLLRVPGRIGRASALGFMVLLPASAIGIYLAIGMPTALDGIPKQPPVLAQADDSTETIDTWMTRAQAYDQEKRPDAARNAYGEVLRLDPVNTVAMIGWIQADMAQHADFAIGDDARSMLDRVLARDPDNQRGLWLLGISDFQHKDYVGARNAWERLRTLLETGSPLEQAVAEKIAIAESMAQSRHVETSVR
jgi:tetratricopeptide (TPR) repeat protein